MRGQERVVTKQGVSGFSRALCTLLSVALACGLIPNRALSYAADQMASTPGPDAMVQAAEPDAVWEAEDSLANGDTIEPERVLIVFREGGEAGQGGADAMDPYGFTMDGEEHALPPNMFERVGYEFCGWSTTPDGKDIPDDPATTDMDEGLVATRVPDGQTMVDLGYDEAVVQEGTADDTDPTAVSRLVPRNLSYAVRDHVLCLYAQWRKTPEATDDSSAETPPADDGEEVPELVDDARAEDPLETAASADACVSTDEAGQDHATCHLEQADGLDALVVEGRDVLTAVDATEVLRRELESGLLEAQEMSSRLVALPQGTPASADDVPRMADGSNIESVSVAWITRDTVENGDDTLLYRRPGDDTSQSVRMRANYALSGEHDYEAGDVTIIVPASVFEYRDGRGAGKLTIPYPEEPKSSSEYNWRRVGDTYVLTNTRRMQAATKGYIEFEVSGLVPHRLADMATSGLFWVRVEVATHLGNTIGLTSNQICAQFDTEEVVTSATDCCSGVSIVDADDVPLEARVGDEDKYVVVDWYMYAHVAGNTEFTLDMASEKTDGYEGVVFFPEAGGTGYAGRVYEGYGSSAAGYKHVRVAYPFSQFDPGVTYTFSNSVSYTLTETDPAVGGDPQRVTTVSANAERQWSWNEPTFIEPQGSFASKKAGNDGPAGTRPSPYAIHDGRGIYPAALNEVRGNSDVEVSYTVESSGDLLPWTCEGDPRLVSSYGRRVVTIVTYDTDDSADRPLCLGMDVSLERGVDYDYTAVRFPTRPAIGIAKASNLDADGGFVEPLGGDGTIASVSDEDTAHVPPVVLEAKVAGAWRQVAVADWSGGPLRLTCGDTTVEGDKVALPRGTEQLRTVVESSNASISHVFCPIITVYADGALGSVAEGLFAQSPAPSVELRNTVRMEAYDDAGAALYERHTSGVDVLQGYSTDISACPSKTVTQSSSGVDYNMRQVVLRYSARVEERSVIPDRDTYELALATGDIVPERCGVWYDLLPKGMSPILSSVALRSGDRVRDVHTIENYKGCGRTLLVVKAELTPVPSGYSNGSVQRYMDAPSISFDAVYPFDSIKDYGSDVHNVIAFESLSRNPLGTVAGYGGEPDNPSSSNNVATARAFDNDIERLVMTGLDPTLAGNRFVYAGVYKSVSVLSAARTSLSKDIQVNNDGVWSQGTYDDRRDVYEGGQYSYRLRMMSDANTDSSDLVLYDSLENFLAGAGNDPADVGAASWRGTLVEVDTSQIAQRGAAPVVYYSTVAQLELADERDANRANATNTSLANGDIWVRADAYAGRMADVRAIAIDCSKKPDGSDFVLGPMESVVALVHMRAPSREEARALIAQDAHAYNNAFLTCTSTDAGTGLGGDSQNFVRHDYTKVGLAEHTLSVRKVWMDGDDRDGVRPSSITVRLYADGRETGESRNLDADEWSATFAHVPYTDEEGRKIHYSVVEDAVEGYTSSVAIDGGVFTLKNTHEPEVVSLRGEKTWEGGEDARPQDITVHLLADGTPVASRRVTPAADGTWHYDFGKQFRYRDGGQEVVYSVREDIDTTRWVAQADGLDIRNTYHPYGDLRIQKTVLGQSAGFVQKRFTFTLELTDDSGAVIPESFFYDTSDGRSGTVGNGDDIELAGGQTAIVHELPHGVAYTVREADEDGYSVTSSSGVTGTVVGNQTVEVHIVNTYTAYGSVNLAAKKELSGHRLQRYQFRGEVRDRDGTILRTATNAADGSMVFGAIGYTEADVGKTYEYTIAETQRTVAGYTFDDSVYKAYVTINDNGDGTLDPQVVYKDESQNVVGIPLFSNEYHATGAVVLKAWKSLQGRTPEAEEFCFELLDQNGVVVDGKRNDRNGEVTFDPLLFDETQVGQTYCFAVREVPGNDDDVVYDDREFAYAVTVFDNGDGTLSFAQNMVDASDMWTEDAGGVRPNPSWEPVPVDGSPVFCNRLKPGGLRVEKHVDSVPGGREEDEFVFHIRLSGEGADSLDKLGCSVVRLSSAGQQETGEFDLVLENGVADVCLHANEAAVLQDVIPAGTTYTVQEQAPGGWVLVSQTDTSGTIQPRTTSVASFTNRYDEASVSVSLAGTKTLDGKATQADAFAFELREGGELIETVRNQAGGGVVFSPLVYNESDVGTHTYEIREVDGGDDDVVYDGHQETVIVEVSKDGPNLGARIVCDEDGIVFANTTKPGSIQIRKEVAGGGDPDQEFEFEVELKNMASSDLAANVSEDDDAEEQTQTSGPGLLDWLADAFSPRKAYAATTPDTSLYWKLDADGTLHISAANTDGTLTGPVTIRSTPPWYSVRTDITAVVVEGTLVPKSTAEWFYDCKNLVDISGLANLDMSCATSIQSMFSGCSALADISVLSGWDTSKVTSMASLFSSCSTLADLTPLSGWVTASVKYFGNAFRNCTSITNVDGLSQWDVRGATGSGTDREGLRYLLYGCTSLRDISGLASWDTSSVRAIDRMLYGCTSLTDVSPLRSWNTSAVANISEMFYGCSALRDISALAAWDTGNLVYASRAFNGCTQLSDLSALAGWDTHKLKDAAGMFEYCQSLTNVSFLQDWDIGAATDIHEMFFGCTSLSDISGLSNWNIGSCKNISSLFGLCTSLVDASSLALWNTANVTNMCCIFEGCTSLADISGLGNWDTSKVTSFNNTFYGCAALEDISELAKWDVGANPYLGFTFCNCSSLKDATPLANWNTGKVSTMERMFYGCEALESADVSEWDMAKVSQSKWLSFNRSLNLKRLTVSANTKLRNYYSEYGVSEHPAGNGYRSTWSLLGTDVCGKTAKEMVDIINRGEGAGTWVWDVDDHVGVIEFDPNGGILMGESRVVQDGEPTPVAAPVARRPGFAFLGWNDKRDGTGVSYDEGSAILPQTGVTLILYAQWEDESSYVDYTVTHQLESAVEPGAFEVVGTETRRGSMLRPVVVEPNVYEGFVPPDPRTISLEPDGSSALVFSYYRTRFDVTLDGNGCADTTVQEFVYRVRQNLNPAPQVENKCFVGWTQSPDGSGILYRDGQAVSFKNAVTLFAQYMDAASVTEQQGLSTVLHVRVKAGETFTIPNVPAGTSYEVREVHIPKGWTLASTEGETGTVGANAVSIATVSNRYAAQGVFDICAYKRLVGAELADGEYRFVLEGWDEQRDCWSTVATAANADVDRRATVADEETGEPVQNAHYGEAPVWFHNIPVGNSGTHTYRIREVGGSDQRVAYDDHEEVFCVRATDNHDGTLATHVAYDEDGPGFRNHVKSGAIQIAKVTENATSASGQTRFAFDVVLMDEAGDPLPNAVYNVELTDADGSVSQYTTGLVDGTSTIWLGGGQTARICDVAVGTGYSVVERHAPGWVQTASSGVRGRVEPNGTGCVSFTNRYEAKGAFDIFGTKVCRGLPLDEGRYTFVLADESGREVSRASNMADGSFAFTGIDIDPSWAGTTKTWYVSEENDGLQHVRYDDHMEMVRAAFTDDGQGNLLADVTYDMDGCTFVNDFVIEMPQTGLYVQNDMPAALPLVLIFAPGAALMRRKRQP